MKISNFGSLASLTAIITLVAIAPEAQAQRTCILDNQNRVICGRLYDPNNPGFDDGFNNGLNRRGEVERSIDSIYQDVLGRSADINGLRAYSDRVLRNSWSYDRVRQELARSSEARSAINQVYVQILRRNADPSGMNVYLRELQNGRSLDWIRQQLASSDEANRFRR
jgi:hypothetical protein